MSVVEISLLHDVSGSNSIHARESFFSRADQDLRPSFRFRERALPRLPPSSSIAEPSLGRMSFSISTPTLPTRRIICQNIETQSRSQIKQNKVLSLREPTRIAYGNVSVVQATRLSRRGLVGDPMNLLSKQYFSLALRKLIIYIFTHFKRPCF